MAVPARGPHRRRLGPAPAGSVCLLGQHPAEYSFELVAELSYEHPEDPVWLLVPGDAGPIAYTVGRAELLGGLVFLIGEAVESG